MATTRRPSKATSKAAKATKATKATKARRSTAGDLPVTRRICNLVPSRDTEQDWQFSDAVGAQLLAVAPVVPNTVDLRQPWWPVGNQEATGSCVGWAVAEGVMRYHFVTAGRLGQDEHLSPRYVWMS